MLRINKFGGIKHTPFCMQAKDNSQRDEADVGQVRVM